MKFLGRVIQAVYVADIYDVNIQRLHRIISLTLKNGFGLIPSLFSEVNRSYLTFLAKCKAERMSVFSTKRLLLRYCNVLLGTTLRENCR